jgi:hypothetical protein
MVFGPDILQEAEKQVHMVRENLRVMQSRQKGYPDHRRRELSFEVGDFVYLKVSPMRGFQCFTVRGKVATRFIGPFKILEKRGEVAYQLELPPQLCDVHDMFHVSQLKKCLRVPEEQIPMEDLDAEEDLSYQEYPIKILETSEEFIEQDDQDVQGAMEPSYRGRSYMGKRRGVEGRVYKFLFRSIRISGTRFILRGGGVGL